MLETIGQIKRKFKKLRSLQVPDSVALEICKKDSTPVAWAKYVATNPLPIEDVGKPQNTVRRVKNVVANKKEIIEKSERLRKRSLARTSRYTIEVKFAKHRKATGIIRDGNNFVILSHKIHNNKELWINKIVNHYKQDFPLEASCYYESFELVKKKSTRESIKPEPMCIHEALDAEQDRVSKPDGIVSTLLVETTHDFELDWNTIEFNDGYLDIRYKNNNDISPYQFTFNDLHVTCPKSRSSFNFLKSYLAQKQFILQAYVKTKTRELVLIDTVKLDNAFEFLKKRANDAMLDDDDPDLMSCANAYMSFEQSMSKASLMSPEMFRRYKSKYIDFLVSKQSKKYLISPCSECLSYANQEYYEEGFFFTIDGGAAHSIIAFENLNPNRATLLFKVGNCRYEESLRAIYNYLSSGLINKRMAIRQQKIKINGTGIVRYDGLNHDYFVGWSSRINAWIRQSYLW